MFNELFNKEDYEITIEDFKTKMDESLQSIIGIDVMKNGGIGKLVKEAVEPVLFGNIECDNTLIKIFCPALGEDDMEEFGRVKYEYKEDKRVRGGIGTTIAKIWFEYTIDTDKVDTYICNISQVLSYDIAKEEFDKCEAELEELQKRIEVLTDEKFRYKEIMRSERYF